jgi:hypothetical protein
MPLDIGTQHRLYMKQLEYLKRSDFAEVLPANFNYQNMIMVSSGTVETDGQSIVFQTYSCGCGPQPLIRSAFLEEEVAWQRSKFRSLLGQSANEKDTALVDQKIFPVVYRIRQAKSAEEKGLIEKALRDHFGANKKINFF